MAGIELLGHSFFSIWNYIDLVTLCFVGKLPGQTYFLPLSTAVHTNLNWIV